MRNANAKAKMKPGPTILWHRVRNSPEHWRGYVGEASVAEVIHYERGGLWGWGVKKPTDARQRGCVGTLAHAKEEAERRYEGLTKD